MRRPLRSRGAAEFAPADAVALAKAGPVTNVVDEDEEDLTEPSDDEADDAVLEDASEHGEDGDMTEVVIAGDRLLCYRPIHTASPSWAPADPYGPPSATRASRPRQVSG